MNNNKKTLQRSGALLLATVLCISAMAGCGTAAQQNTTEKPTTQQSQQATPKADSGKKDSDKKTDSGKPADNKSGTGKPADKKEAPSIKTQPQNVKVAKGSSFKFTVSASEANLKYVWQVDKNDGKGWTDIPNANEVTYSVKSAGAEQNGWKFRCIVSNDAGKAESAVATLSVSQ